MSNFNTNIERKQGGNDVNFAAGGNLQFKDADCSIKRGEVALDGSNPTPVTTGLSSIAAVFLTLKSQTAPGVETSVLSYDTTGGTLNIYAWKVTATNDATLVASTGTETVGYIAIGTQ